MLVCNVIAVAARFFAATALFLADVGSARYLRLRPVVRACCGRLLKYPSEAGKKLCGADQDLLRLEMISFLAE